MAKTQTGWLFAFGLFVIQSIVFPRPIGVKLERFQWAFHEWAGSQSISFRFSLQV